MKYRGIHSRIHLATAFSLPLLLLAGNAVAQQDRGGQAMDAAKARVVEHWTSERRANAIPRDLVIDSRGLGYLRRPDGSLQPHGHQIVAENSANMPSPNARPGGGGNDTEPPFIGTMNPDGATIGASHTFSAVVTDNVEVRSVSFTIIYPGGTNSQTFNASADGGGVWSVSLSGFTDDPSWSWRVDAKDTAKKGGNTSSAGPVSFSVDTGGGGSGGGSNDTGGTVTNAEWTYGGKVQTAAGRLYFEMPNNAKRKGPWNGYVCSGTAVTDGTGDDRSIILTAAHCVYDDANKAFARNVLFIPDQAHTDGTRTDLDCDNDPLGCWVPSFGVVDTDWTTRTFPDNIPWDYAYYVVKDTGAHSGSGSLESLEVAAGTLAINFATPLHDDGMSGDDNTDYTHALGYSYDVDPNFMYCAEDMTKEGADNWWLASCGLSGGSSGGPWVQPMDIGTGDGPVISINSWGYVGSPGMAGPKLDSTSAECVFGKAEGTSFSSVSATDGEAGVAVDAADSVDNCP
jgi:hypothetical protein